MTPLQEGRNDNDNDNDDDERTPLKNKASSSSAAAASASAPDDTSSRWGRIIRGVPWMLLVIVAGAIITFHHSKLLQQEPQQSSEYYYYDDSSSSSASSSSSSPAVFSSSSSTSSSAVGGILSDPYVLELLHQLDSDMKGNVIIRPSISSSSSSTSISDVNIKEETEKQQEWEFEQAAHVWNQVTKNPLAVVQVANEEDVAIALPVLIELSSSKRLVGGGIPFRIRSGGHHYAGWSGMEDGIILSLSNLNQIEKDADLLLLLNEQHGDDENEESSTSTSTSSSSSSVALWLGPVVRVQDILQQVHQKYQYSSVIGMCRTVAVGGYALGGGQGLWARYYGLGLDQVLAARLVLANGTMITTNATHRPDILWALQGAGQNNFGVVTQLQYQFYPSYDDQVFLSGTIAHKDMPRFFHEVAVMEEQNLIPGEIGAFFSNGDTLDTYSIIIWYTCFQDQDIPIGKAYLKSQILPLLLLVQEGSEEQDDDGVVKKNNEESASPAPSNNNNNINNFNMSVGSWFDLSMNRVPLREGNYVRIWNGFLYAEQNTMKACQEIWDLFHEARSISEYAKVGIELWGGAIRRNNNNNNNPKKAKDSTAFYWRDAIYNVHLWLNVPTNLTDAEERFELDRLALEPIWAKMAKHHLTGTYLNYAEASLKDDEYARVTYGGNLERLVELKRELDPFNVFSNPQSIPLELY